MLLSQTKYTRYNKHIWLLKKLFVKCNEVADVPYTKNFLLYRYVSGVLLNLILYFVFGRQEYLNFGEEPAKNVVSTICQTFSICHVSSVTFFQTLGVKITLLSCKFNLQVSMTM